MSSLQAKRNEGITENFCGNPLVSFMMELPVIYTSNKKWQALHWRCALCVSVNVVVKINVKDWIATKMFILSTDFAALNQLIIRTFSRNDGGGDGCSMM